MLSTQGTPFIPAFEEFVTSIKLFVYMKTGAIFRLTVY